MTDKELKPISKTEEDEFNRRRESASVVQTKCEACNAWYESDKQNEPFQETFFCDCGAYLSFPVPALERKTVILPSDNEARLALLDGDQRLDTGMKIEEALQRSALWWEKTGRKMMKREHERQSKTVGGSDNGAGSAFASKDQADPNFLPSGLIHGLPWEALSRRERLMAVKVWHHFKIRNPDLIGEDDRITHKMQDRGKVQ